MKQTSSPTASGWLVTRVGRLALFAGAGLLAIFATGAVVDSSIIRILVAAIFAPWGLAFLIPGLSNSMLFEPSVWIGWLIYLGLVTAGTFASNRRAWVILFITFIALVLLNMGGCVAYCHTHSPVGDCFSFSISVG